MHLPRMSLEQLKALEAEGVEQVDYYAHRNPLVRWIFWKRLDTMIKLDNRKNFGGRALDFGAGSGWLTMGLSKQFEEVHAIDLSTKSLNYFKKKYNLANMKVKKSIGEDKLPYGDEFFDAVFAADVLEHFRDSTAMQSEFKRVLKKGGLLIISGPTENFVYEIARAVMSGHKKPFDHYTDIDDILNKSKEIFKIEKVKVLPLPIIPGFKVYRARKE